MLIDINIAICCDDFSWLKWCLCYVPLCIICLLFFNVIEIFA